jgi:hypothetical protein
VACIPDGSLRNIHGQVADPLEVGVDLDGRDNRAQVRGHRLMQRQQHEAAVVDFDVQRVERPVAPHHALEQRPIPLDEPLDRKAHLLFSEAAHFEQPRLALLELFAEMRHHPLAGRHRSGPI